MRSARSLLALIVVAAGLGSYIYFVEMKTDPVADTAKAREKVFTMMPGTVEEVEITNATGEVTRAVRKEAAWSLVAPEALEADAAEVGRVASSLETLERVKVIDENPASATPFGLAPARMRVAFKVAGDAAQKVLLIGTKTPTGGDLYAKLEDAPAVFLIGGFLEDTFNRKPFDLRDKTALKFASDAVDAITVAQGATKLSFSKSGTNWRIGSPDGAKADQSAMGTLINQLGEARMTSITAATATPAQLREFGFDKPQAVVTLGAGSSKAELAIGKKEDDTHVYARDLSRPMVFSVDKTLLDELLKKSDDYRVKDIFTFRSFTASGLDVVSDGKTFTFTKKMGEGENPTETWSLTAPEAKATDESKVSDLLMTLSNLRAENFAEKALTGGEAITVTARFGDASLLQTETVTLRKVGDVVQATRTGEPGAAVVSTADFDRALSAFKELVK